MPLAVVERSRASETGGATATVEHEHDAPCLHVEGDEVDLALIGHVHDHAVFLLRLELNTEPSPGNTHTPS